MSKQFSVCAGIVILEPFTKFIQYAYISQIQCAMDQIRQD